MSERIHALAKLLFDKNSIDECDPEEIRKLASKYPYFAPAQFLLLQKLKQQNAPEYNEQWQKAVLYYHDPLQFEYFISSEKFYTDPATLALRANAAPDANIIDTETSDSRDEAGVTEPLIEIPAPDDNVEAKPSDSMKEETVVEEKNLNQQESPADFVFEPFHTVDYFASQGIKPSQEPPSDAFGKQVKSFTEWLKTMKRLPAADVAKNVDTVAEKKVVNMATHSVDKTEVVTEAMAEVWLKQGNNEKAIEIFRKLSLLNPSKKAFFAAKIDSLKNS